MCIFNKLVFQKHENDLTSFPVSCKTFWCMCLASDGLGFGSGNNINC